MSSAPTQSRRRGAARAFVAATILLAGVALLLLWRMRQPTVPSAHLSPSAPAAGGPADRRLPSLAAPSVPAPTEPASPPTRPIIDSITIEKKEVCRGEENMVTVKAHTTDGGDAYLRGMVGGRLGTRVPVRSWDRSGSSGTAVKVSVFGKGSEPALETAPAYLVKDCEVPHYAVLAYRQLENSWDEYELSARVLAPPTRGKAVDDGFATSSVASPVGNRASVPFRPVRYQWDFGDGTSAVTDSPVVSHNYGRRRQDRKQSELLVAVKVTAEDGNTVEAHQAMILHNPAFESYAQKGIVLLMHELNPRFPKLGADGAVTQKVRLWHTRDVPVTITNLQLRRQSRGNRSEVVEADPLQTLGTVVIPPGEGVTISARLNTTAAPDVTYVDYQLVGRTADGDRASGSFSIMRPAPPPTREAHEPISDPVLLAKVKVARGLLSRPVTDSDLRRLEQQGAFANLQPPTAP